MLLYRISTEKRSLSAPLFRLRSYSDTSAYPTLARISEPRPSLSRSPGSSPHFSVNMSYKCMKRRPFRVGLSARSAAVPEHNERSRQSSLFTNILLYCSLGRVSYTGCKIAVRPQCILMPIYCFQIVSYADIPSFFVYKMCMLNEKLSPKFLSQISGL